jgi:hypothetical protein
MCAVELGNNLIEPQVIKGFLAALYYRNFLQHKLLLHFEDVPLATQRNTWLQHNRAP